LCNSTADAEPLDDILGGALVEFSKLDVNDHDDDDGSDDGDVVRPARGSVHSKTYRRRIIDDDDGGDDDESTIGGTSSDASSDDGGSRISLDSAAEACEPPVDILGGGFAGLTLEEEDDRGEESRGGGGASDGNSPDYNDASLVCGDGSAASVGSGESDETKDDDDDESVMCFEGCGCWELDVDHPGELYLSDNSDVKWPGIRLPLALYNKLFQHQRIGVQWMASLHRNKIKGGILADDMGMGKTMQTLAYLGSLMRASTISNAMIVCPKSVVRNWEREANLILKNMCVPKASIYAVTSDMSKEKRKNVFTDAFTCSPDAPRLVITTYGLVSNHITDLHSIADAFQENHWNYIILDEGHLIKNSRTKTSQDVRILSLSKKTRRLLLTGTPIQNNMRELFALFDWATSSKLLGSIKTFLNKYGDPIEEGRQRNASQWTINKAAEMNAQLKEVLQPYFLQRLKKTTFDDKMPEKKELVVFTQLSAKQRHMYEDYTESVFDGGMTSPLAAVSWLKMLCGHPSLVKEAAGKYKDCDADVLVRDSTKLQVLLALIHRLKRSGHKALIFSQSTKMLDIFEKVFSGSIRYLRIDGSTAGLARQKAVDHFNGINSEIDVMLLSTKAAGIGLTLTGADRAVIYDPSWNPAEDAQAVDRCYRIGQTKDVTVYRFIAAGTVEEKMYEKQVHKDGIKRVVLSNDRSTARYFDHSELKDLFKLAKSGECPTMEKFNEKIDNNGAGSSGKPSFLTKHPSVIGVASHDVLYSNDTINVDLDSPTSESAPFSRSPFQKTKLAKRHLPNQLEDLTVDMPGNGQHLKPLGGLNKTRQNREDAKAQHAQVNCITSVPNIGSVDIILSEADISIANGEHGKAMYILLDLVEREMDSIKGDVKLDVHNKISHVACLLGWL